MNLLYLAIVLLTMVVIPLIGLLVERFAYNRPISLGLFGKWFIFSAVGIRLFTAGLRQALSPEFTAKEIFHIHDPNSLPIVRELGFANLCFGLVGIISLFRPMWRKVSAVASGTYYGLAGLLHLVNKPVNVNEQIALWSDMYVCAILIVYAVYERTE